MKQMNPIFFLLLLLPIVGFVILNMNLQGAQVNPMDSYPDTTEGMKKVTDLMGAFAIVGIGIPVLIIIVYIITTKRRGGKIKW